MTDLLIIEIIREDTKLKMSAFKRSEQSDLTLKHYSELAVLDKEIAELSGDITMLLAKANRSGTLEDSYLSELKKIGQLLYDQLLTFEVKEKLKGLRPYNLLFSMDEKLVQIPWEVLFDGEEFLCLKYSLGRSVRTRQKPHALSSHRPPSSSRRMLIIADPTGDLEGAYLEGTEIRNELDKRKNKIKVDLLTTELNARFVKKNIHDYDFIHFAGHADYDQDPSQSGWLFKEGKLTSKEIVQLGGSLPLPLLVFSNACESAKTQEWKIDSRFEDKIYGLANAFLLAGTKHYIGTFWKVADKSSFAFAKEFYKELLKGVSIGDALKLSRKIVLQIYGAQSIIWASYLLYGDPSSVLFPVQTGITTNDPGFHISRKTQYMMAAALLAIALVFAALFGKDILEDFTQLRTHHASSQKIKLP